MTETLPDLPLVEPAPLDFAWAVVTCRTEGCENVDIPITVQVVVPDGLVQCGPCGAWITDITLVEEPTDA